MKHALLETLLVLESVLFWIVALPLMALALAAEFLFTAPRSLRFR